MVAEQQGGKNHPGCQREYGLVRQVLSEHALQKHEAADDRQREQRHAGPDQLEQDALHGGQGRQYLNHPPGMMMTQRLVLQAQQHGLAGGNEQHAEGQCRAHGMQGDAWCHAVGALGARQADCQQQGEARDRKQPDGNTENRFGQAHGEQQYHHHGGQHHRAGRETGHQAGALVDQLECHRQVKQQA